MLPWNNVQMLSCKAHRILQLLHINVGLSGTRAKKNAIFLFPQNHRAGIQSAFILILYEKEKKEKISFEYHK